MNTANNLLKLTALLEDNASSIIAFLKSFTFQKGGTIYTCGNGGSATQAMHLTEELLGKYDKSRTPIPSICLNSCAATLTCIANDFGYENVFSRQIEALVKSSDTLVLFTTSGMSNNISQAILAALKIGCQILLLNGRDGGKARWLTIHNDSAKELLVKGDNSARIQEVHEFVMHELVEKAERELL
jgi:D-sedoheptulose 7-phosphate isomerase